MESPLALLESVSVSLARAPVLVAVSLQVAPGNHLGITGPNGSGKTTLLRVLAGLIVPSAGKGSILGAPLGTPDVFSVRGRIGLVGHTASLLPELTLAENLRHVCRMGGYDETRTEAALHAVGLEGAAGTRALAASNGMQRRLDLARILITRPRLLLLDESHAGLDSGARMLVEAVAGEAVERGGAVVSVSHDKTGLGQCDRLLSLHAGVLVPA